MLWKPWMVGKGEGVKNDEQSKGVRVETSCPPVLMLF